MSNDSYLSEGINDDHEHHLKASPAKLVGNDNDHSYINLGFLSEIVVAFAESCFFSRNEYLFENEIN